MKLLVLETLRTAILHSLRLLFSSRNRKSEKSFRFTLALNSLKAVIGISIFSKEVPW